MNRQSKSLVVDFGLIYCALIWGSTFFLVKSTLTNINPITLVAFRFLFSALIIGIYLIFTGKKLFTQFKSGLILGSILWLIYLPQTIGLEYTSASDSGFITGLFIVFVPLFNYIFFKNTPTRLQIIAVAVSLFGLWLLTGELKGFNYGDLLTLICAMAYAGHLLVANKYVKNEIDPYVLSFQQFLVVGALSAISCIVFNISFSFHHTDTLWVLLFLTLGPTLSAFVIQLVAQKSVAPLKVSLIFALEPVFAAIFAWTIGGETFILQGAIGGFLIFLGMIISSV